MDGRPGLSNRAPELVPHVLSAFKALIGRIIAVARVGLFSHIVPHHEARTMPGPPCLIENTREKAKSNRRVTSG